MLHGLLTYLAHSVLLSDAEGYDPRLLLLGASCVAGNQTVDKVTRNCLSILEAAGLDETGQDSCYRVACHDRWLLTAIQSSLQQFSALALTSAVHIFQ